MERASALLTQVPLRIHKHILHLPRAFRRLDLAGIEDTRKRGLDHVPACASVVLLLCR